VVGFLLPNERLLSPIRQFYEAKQNKLPTVTIWGTGKPKREFLHVDDLADACIFLMKNYNGRDTINIGTGKDVSIRQLALEVKKITGYGGKLVFDTTKPDGTPRKLLNVKKLHTLGWKHKIDLTPGIKKTYRAFLEEMSDGNIRGFL
jgi:GDP-L-fucose synthase